MATYTASNAIKKITTGDESGSWGNSTNNNFDIIDRAANGFVSISLPSTSYTLALSTTAVLSNGHYKAINFTGTPGGTCTVTLEQNDKARMYMILNSTNQSLSITQGSGSNVTILAGKSAIILADGAGSGAAVTDFTSLVSISELDGITAGTVTASKSVVVDANKDITGFRNITATGDVDIDGTTNLDIVDIDGAVNIAAATTIATDNKIQFRDTGLYINSSADGQLDLVADTEIQIAATTIDINGAVVLNGAITGATDITLSGELDAATLDISGNADIDGTLEADVLTVDGAAAKVAGLETIYVPSGAMYPNGTNGCSMLTQVELSNGPEIKVLDFDPSSDENAQFTVCFPKSWNEGTITFQPFWTVTGTDTGTVAWGLSGVSIANDGSINTAFGTNVVTTAKAFSGTSNDLMVSDTSGAVTIASAAVDTQTYFQIMRDVSADSQTGDARLLGIKLFFTTDAKNDA